jgi:hypothetical protein
MFEDFICEGIECDQVVGSVATPRHIFASIKLDPGVGASDNL